MTTTFDPIRNPYANGPTVGTATLPNPGVTCTYYFDASIEHPSMDAERFRPTDDHQTVTTVLGCGSEYRVWIDGTDPDTFTITVSMDSGPVTVLRQHGYRVMARYVFDGTTDYPPVFAYVASVAVAMATDDL